MGLCLTIVAWFMQVEALWKPDFADFVALQVLLSLPSSVGSRVRCSSSQLWAGAARKRGDEENLGKKERSAARDTWEWFVEVFRRAWLVLLARSSVSPEQK